MKICPNGNKKFGQSSKISPILVTLIKQYRRRGNAKKYNRVRFEKFVIPTNEKFSLKMGQKWPLFVSTFVLFTMQLQKRGWCDWDMNPGPQDPLHYGGPHAYVETILLFRQAF